MVRDFDDIISHDGCLQMIKYLINKGKRKRLGRCDVIIFVDKKIFTVVSEVFNNVMFCSKNRTKKAMLIQHCFCS